MWEYMLQSAVWYVKQCGVFIADIRKNEEKVWVNCGDHFADNFFFTFP